MRNERNERNVDEEMKKWLLRDILSIIKMRNEK